MAFKTKDMTGALFPNDKKGNAAWADLRGSVTIEGKKYWLSGWNKTTKDGTEMISLAVKPAPAAKDDF
jgi:hypothetical protein